MLKMITVAGIVQSDGTVDRGINFTVEHVENTGSYKIKATGFGQAPVVVVSPMVDVGGFDARVADFTDPGTFTIIARDTGITGKLKDCAFSFIAHGPSFESEQWDKS